MSDGATPDAALVEAASELYGCPPDEFTKRRAALAASADKAVASRITKLPKPVVAAWLVNMLARHRPERLAELAELGERIAEAQSQLDTDALRTTGRERARLVSAVARDAVALADELDRPVSDGVARDVELTLEAAAVNSDVAEALRGGTLVTAPLSPDASEGDVASAVAVQVDAPKRRRQPEPRAEPVDELAEKRREKALQAVADAKVGVSSAEDALGSLTSRREKAVSVRDSASEERAELSERLAQLGERIEQLDAQLDKLTAERDDARERLKQKKSSLRRAMKRLDELG